MGAARGAAEEHRGGASAEVGEELLDLGCVMPATEAQVVSELIESVRVGYQFAVADLADERGCLVAVDEPMRVLPGMEAGGAAGDLAQSLLADAVESARVDELAGEPLGRAAVCDAPGSEAPADLLDGAEGRGVDPPCGAVAAGTALGAFTDGSAGERIRVVAEGRQVGNHWRSLFARQPSDQAVSAYPNSQRTMGIRRGTITRSAGRDLQGVEACLARRSREHPVHPAVNP